MQHSLLEASSHACLPFKKLSDAGRIRIRTFSRGTAVTKLDIRCSQKGFGSGTAGQKKKQRRSSSGLQDEGWTMVAKADVFQGKQIKAVEVEGKIMALYNVDSQIYCSDANSTAYQFPITNGKILKRENGPAVEVSLDGTVYDLKTGKVLDWCPRNNPFRAVLGTLKGNQVPKNLNVYPAKLDEASGEIFVQIS